MKDMGTLRTLINEKNMPFVNLRELVVLQDYFALFFANFAFPLLIRFFRNL